MWFWYSLSAATLSAVSVIINKRVLKNVSPLLLSWSLFSLSIPLLFVVAFKDGMPKVNGMFFFGALGSALFFVFAKNISLDVIKNHDLSRIYPLSSIGPLFAYVLALIFLSEHIRPIALAGILCIAAGTYTLNIEQAKEHILKPFGLLFGHKGSFLFLVAVFLSTCSALFDKIGVTNTFPTNAAATLLLENICMGILLGTLLTKHDRTWIHKVRIHFVKLFIASVIYSAMGILLLTGFAEGPLAFAYVIKKTEIFFILFMSYIFFKDRLTKHVWFASALMLIGIFLIKAT